MPNAVPSVKRVWFRGLFLPLLLVATVTVACQEEGAWRDAEGVIQGSGDIEYYYDGDTSKLQRVDTYQRGELIESRWFRPDGSPVAETQWEDGSGLDYYLYDDGTIRREVPMVNGVAHGMATYYDQEGDVVRRQLYVDGVESDSDATVTP